MARIGRVGAVGDYSRARLVQIIEEVGGVEGNITAVTAGDGMSGGGSQGAVTLNIDYAGSDSVIKAATNGTGITVNNSDLILVADADDSDNVKYINISQLPNAVAGSDTQVQFNDEGTMVAASNLSYADSTGYLGVGTTGNNITHAITLPDTAGAAGRVKANAYLTYSSIQYKDNINTIKEPLKIISEIRGVTFNWKKDQVKDFGFIAEEIGKRLPNIVDWEEKSGFASSMDYTRIIPILVEGIKDQQLQIDALKSEIISLNATLKANS